MEVHEEVLMVVAEKSRTGSHKWENDWCPKCKERMTFWYVTETRTKCAQCALEKDKARGLGLGPVFEPEPEPQPAAPAPAPVPAAAVPAPVEPPPAPPAPAREPEPTAEFCLSWCGECHLNSAFLRVRRDTFRCGGCGSTKEIAQLVPARHDPPR